ncbi:ribonuclease P protein component [Marinospirillum alkalitolerans]|uniref:ribonuclease P protein component n=1 Tax=Marinospirillum alkalitolerans TaxID=3123374 RepID=UPI00386C2852
MKNCGFPRSKRLLTPGDFRYVFDHTQHKAFCCGYLLLATPARTPESRIGFVFAKKNLRLAVQRNRVKRIFRESFRTHQQAIPLLDLVVLATKSVNRQQPDAQLAQELIKAWQQLARRVGYAQQPHSRTTKRQ